MISSKGSDNDEFEVLDKHVQERNHVKNEGPSKKREQINDKEKLIASTRKSFDPNKRLNF